MVKMEHLKILIKSRIQAFIPKTYDRIVSIGSNCEVTWNIRNHFSTDKAYPFDWWMTPLHSMIELLDAQFTGLFDKKNICVPPDLKTVIDKKYNIMHHHDFQRDEAGLIVSNKIEEQLSSLKQKYDFLAKRFKDDLDGKRILFIRNRCGNDPNYLNGDYGEIQPEQCIEMHRALSALLPQAKFDIFATNKTKFDSFFYNGSEIFSDSIVNLGDCDDYRVSPKGWSKMFRQHNIKLKKK